MDNAIACNARAIFKMESGDYEGAFNLLRTSVLSLTCTAHNEMMKLVEPPSSESRVQTGKLHFISTARQSDIERFYPSSFLFSDPFSGKFIGALSKQAIDFGSACCLFNMALACHLEYEASTDCRKRSILLSQARTLYLTAYELLQKYPIEPTDSIILLLMALCANLMDVEMEFGSLDEVRFWRKILEDASFAADPMCFEGTSVFVFFDSVYVAPGEMIAARAA